MKCFSLSLLYLAVRAAFQTTGEVPDQDAQIFLVVDTSMTNNLADFFARMTSKDMMRLTSVYEDAGYTITAGVAKTGASDKTCYKTVATVPTNLTDLNKIIVDDHFNANPDAKERYTWYALMHAAGYEVDTVGDTRKVLVALTDKIMPLGSAVVTTEIEELVCGLSQPPADQFVRYIQRAEAGLIFGAQHNYKKEAGELASQAAAFFEELGLSDVGVSQGYMWSQAGGSSVQYRNHVDILEKLLSPSWIASTSTTLSPKEKLRRCVEEAFDCSL